MTGLSPLALGNSGNLASFCVLLGLTYFVFIVSKHSESVLRNLFYFLIYFLSYYTMLAVYSRASMLSFLATIFLGAFLAVTLFVFFWVEKFFSRNIADVRPLFEWMPLLLIFLSAAITMRMWSEERRAGTTRAQAQWTVLLPVSVAQRIVDATPPA